MMVQFITALSVLIVGEILQQTSANNLEHFANGVDQKNIGDWENEQDKIRRESPVTGREFLEIF